MSAIYTALSSLSSVHLADRHGKLEFKYDDIVTVQGLNLKRYNLLSNTISSLTKNYTYNNLSLERNINNVATYQKPVFLQDLNTKLHFYGSDSSLSHYTVLVESNYRDEPNNIYFKRDTFDINSNQQKVLVDFIDDINCQIIFMDGKVPKHLFVNVGSDIGNYLTFTFLNKENEHLGNHIFKYAYDKDNLFLTLLKTINGQEYVIAPSLAQFPGVEDPVETLSATPLTQDNLQAGIIRVNNKIEILHSEYVDQYVYYNHKQGYELSDDSVQNITYDFLSYLTFEDLYTKDGKIYGDVDFFNLKNHISDNNLIQPASKLENPLHKRRYNSIVNKNNVECENENISFNYNFYSKDYTLLPDKISTFTLPDNIFPYVVLNINDTSIGNSGAYGALSPYFSDRIYKLQDKVYEYDNINYIIDQNDVNYILDVDGGFIILQSDSDKQQTDTTGTYLCTWFKKSSDSEGIWLDRYYIPSEYSYTEAISGNTNQVYVNNNEAKDYFSTNGIKDSFYDVESNMTFEPNSTYIYQRIGKTYIQSVIDTQNDSIVKDSFNIQLSDRYLSDQNQIDFKTVKGFDQIPFEEINSKNFNISFELELDSLSSLDSYQLIGNLYNDGFTFRNNFYFTPHIFIVSGNSINIFDKDLNLINKHTYSDVQKIIDVLYLEQHNDMVLVCNDRLIKTNIYGEIVDEVVHDLNILGRNLESLIRSYKSKSYYGYNNVIILTNNDLNIHVDLNNLHVKLIDVNHDIEKAHNSIINTKHGFRKLVGLKGRLLNEDTAVSMDNIPRYIVIDRLPGVLENPIPAITFENTPLQWEYPNGIPARTIFDEDQFNEIVFYGQAVDQNITSKFNTAGHNRVIYDDINTDSEISPIIDSKLKRLYDINTFNEQLFIQYVNLEQRYQCMTDTLYRSVFEDDLKLYDKYLNGIPENWILKREDYLEVIAYQENLSGYFDELLLPAEGKIQIYDSKRYPLSSFTLNTQVMSGYKIDFINNGDEIQLLSLAKDLSGHIIADKFSLSSGELIQSTNLGISGNDNIIQDYYFCKNSINGVNVNDMLTESEYLSATVGLPSPLNYFDKVETQLFADPVGMNQIYTKYMDYQNDLYFQFGINTYIPREVEGLEWQEAGPDEYSQFHYNNPPDFKTWGAFKISKSEDPESFEVFIKAPPLQIKNFFNFDFNLENGHITLYHNGLIYGEIKFQSNYFPITRLLYPNLFFNTPNIKNKSVSKINSNGDFFSKGGQMKNCLVYNKQLNTDVVDYLYLKTTCIDDLNFEIQCGTRNNIEEISTLYNYRIPGSKADISKIYIKNISIDDATTRSMIEYLNLNIYKSLPFNVQKLIYNVNGDDYEIIDNKVVKLLKR